MNKTALNGRYHWHELFVCKVFSNAHHFDEFKTFITLTKVINRKESLESEKLRIYSGLWIPLIVNKNETTKSMYIFMQEDYLRYLSLSSLITVRPTEWQFYIQNKQKSIVRKFEVFFQNVLFFNVTLELFRLIFLISKLLLLPFG